MQLPHLATLPLPPTIDSTCAIMVWVILAIIGSFSLLFILG
ncbi:hypothetical protein VCHC59A1_0249 [Vibrio cholerae HC-59A1]|nr:hypothetical protein VCHC55A1_0214 [Vibrio cholerae HC-55A1]EKL17782.1 hypothetical protein VCHC59A1_0249 [Vibrio cholerae HC-59A1]EKM02071.1 hypothetical protein VCHC55B2_0214 [Vibrio cholerae HC-55B2]